MQNSEACVPERELVRFVHGNLDEVRLHEIAAHVDDCVDCQDTVVAMAEHSDTFVEAIRQVGSEVAEPHENALKLGLKRMLASMRGSFVERMHNTRGSKEGKGQPDVHLESRHLGPYLVGEQLGAGGMGNVYRATHTKLKRTVALKVLPSHRWSNTIAVSRFEREMEAIGTLDHPNIVRASDAGEDQGMHYLVMEYVDGLDLARLVNRLGRLAPADACELARQAALGLHHAHESGLVHRDIKPSNLMLAWNRQQSLNSTNPPTLKILDLGLALLGDEHLQTGHELTTVGTLMGTLDYMSPEQGVDSHSVDQRTDIYSLGATLFKLLTGRAPYADPGYGTLMKKMTALATKAAPSIGSVRDDLPQGLVEVIDKMLSRDPDNRYASGRDVAASLEPFAAKARLDTLLRQALQEDDPESPAVAPVAPAFARTATPAKANPANGDGGHASRGWLIAAAGGSLLVVAGIIFQIATDVGELVIRSDDPNATVVVKRDDKKIEELQIRKGEEESLRLWTGHYRLEVIGDANVSIVPNEVKIERRGSEQAMVATTNIAKNATATRSDDEDKRELAVVVADLKKLIRDLHFAESEYDKRLQAVDALTPSDDLAKDVGASKQEQQVRISQLSAAQDHLERLRENYHERQAQLKMQQKTLALRYGEQHPLRKTLAIELETLQQYQAELENRKTRATRARPYEIQPGKKIRIQVLGVAPERPISGTFVVEASGGVHLGPGYGRVLVSGLTFVEAEEAIRSTLLKVVSNPEVMVTDVMKSEGMVEPLVPPSAATQADSGPTYGGKPFDAWIDELRTARGSKARHLLQAIAVLGREGNSLEAAREILAAMRNLPIEVTAGEATASLIELNRNDVLKATLEEFEQGNARSRDFICRLAESLSNAQEIGDAQRLRDAFRAYGVELAKARLANPADDSERATVERFLEVLALRFEVDANGVPGMLEVLATSRSAEVLLYLAKYAPGSPGLAENLWHLIKDSLSLDGGGYGATSAVSTARCFQALQQLGPNADPVVFEIIEALELRIQTLPGKRDGKPSVSVQDLDFVEPAVKTLGTIEEVPDRAIELLRSLEAIDLRQAPSLGRQVRKSLQQLGLDLKGTSARVDEVDSKPRIESGPSASLSR